MTGKDDIRRFILEEILQSQETQEISDDLDLIGLHILDSLSILKLISHLEQKNNVSIEIDELNFDQFQSINAIYDFVVAKVANNG